jgi:hypothetical protein
MGLTRGRILNRALREARALDKDPHLRSSPLQGEGKRGRGTGMGLTRGGILNRARQKRAGQGPSPSILSVARTGEDKKGEPEGD